MLNPDGAERYQRRNAPGHRHQPGRAAAADAKRARAQGAARQAQPPVGFNLHNQGWRTSAGKDRSAGHNFPAVGRVRRGADGEPGTASDETAVARSSATALEPLATGRIARYDDEFEVRGVRDNLTKWGTNVVLIETGPWPAIEPDPYLVRLNFVALITALDGLSTGRVKQADRRRYETLRSTRPTSLPADPQRDGHSRTGCRPFTADIGIVANRGVRTTGGERGTRLTARIDDLGDLHNMSALESVDAAGLFVAPLWDPAIKAGDVVMLPDFAAQRAAASDRDGRAGGVGNTAAGGSRLQGRTRHQSTESGLERTGWHVPAYSRSRRPAKRSFRVLSAARGAPLRHPTWASALSQRFADYRCRLVRGNTPEHASPPPGREHRHEQRAVGLALVAWLMAGANRFPNRLGADGVRPPADAEGRHGRGGARAESDRRHRRPRRCGCRHEHRRGCCTRRPAGPVLAIVAGAHGTEYSSIIAIERLIQLLDPAQMSDRSSSCRWSTSRRSSRRSPT